jgi:hypothetical protein
MLADAPLTASLAPTDFEDSITVRGRDPQG